MGRIRVSLNRIAIVALLAILLACNLASAYSSTNQVDVVIAFDTTGSMGSYINSMKANAIEFAGSLASSDMDYRLGLTEFKDFPISCGSYCGDPGDFAYKIHNFGILMKNPIEFNAFITSLRASGGADAPESHLSALKHTVTDQQWRGGAVQKVIILISDAPPHVDGNCCNVEGDTFSSIKNLLKSESVTVYVVGRDYGGGGVPNGWATDLAAFTGGKYYPLGDLKPVLKDIVNKMEAIKISPQDPTTKKDVITFNADVKLSVNEEITSQFWKVGDVQTGKIDRQGCSIPPDPWTYKPPAEKYGNKNVLLVTQFKNKVTGKAGFDVRSRSFKIFFDKGTVDKPADDDGDVDNPLNNKNGVIGPNWFEYWIKDGAVPGMRDFEYVKDASYLGQYDPNTNKFYLGRKASGEKRPFTITLDSGKTETFFGNADFKGINSVASTVAHEKYHSRVFDETEFSGMDLTDSDKWQGPEDNVQLCQDGQCYPKTPLKINQPCPDGLPDEYETKKSQTLKDNPDTYDLPRQMNLPKPADVNGITTLHAYHFNGDQELMSFRKGSEIPVVDETKDWANPGKQTSVVFSPLPSAKKPLKVTPAQSLTESKIAGNYMDSAIDSNGNGLFDNLKINFDVQVDKDNFYTLIGRIKDNSGKEIELISSEFSMLAGVNNVELAFEGLKINRNGINGPYTFTVALYDWMGNWLDSQVDAYQTAAYDYADFEGQQASITDGFADIAEDSNGDGAPEGLRIKINVDVKKSGRYKIEGYLYGEVDNPVDYAETEVTLAEGLKEIELNFSGSSIAFSEWNGQYMLRYLSLYDELGTLLDFELDPYLTKAYDSKDFKSTAASLDNFTDAGEDANGDGFFENLKILIGVDVLRAGNYLIEGDLRDSEGNEIETIYAQMYLDVGSQTIQLMFKGKTIYDHGVSGAFNLTNLLLYNESGFIIDSKKHAYTTGSYNYSDFKPLIVLTEEYSDSGEDTNANGLFDSLVINVGLEVAKSGNIVANARLLDPTGNEITRINSTALIEAGGPRTMQLKFKGSEIFNHAVNGPYLLSDLYVYHAIDPTPVNATEVYTTSTYRYQEFEQNLPPNTPSMPSGIKSGYAWVPYSYKTSATDPDGDQVMYTIDWGDGTNSTTGLVNSTTSATLTHTWTAAGTYQIRAMSTDSKGATSAWSASLAVTIAPNKRPNAPSKLIGPTSGYVGVSYPFLTSAIDPNGDKVKYVYDWGDGTTYTTPLVNSGTTASISHKWTVDGTYRVRTMTIDSKGAPSAWSTILTVKIANRFGAADEISTAEDIGAMNELDPANSAEEKIQEARERIDEARSAIRSVRDKGENL